VLNGALAAGCLQCSCAAVAVQCCAVLKGTCSAVQCSCFRVPCWCNRLPHRTQAECLHSTDRLSRSSSWKSRSSCPGLVPVQTHPRPPPSHSQAKAWPLHSKHECSLLPVAATPKIAGG